MHLLRILSFAIFTLAVLGGAEYLDPHCNGKQVIVHLFEWKWTDIAAECERFLGPWGFCGVQVSPPMEHVVITNPPYPWWQRYQPVSYKIDSRSGNEQQFADMAKRCNAVGVRIIVDSVVNHMTGSERNGVGSAGTRFDGGDKSYPGVPYTTENFNGRSKCNSGCGCVNNYGDPSNVRDCKLLSLNDLDQSQDYVRKKISEYYNHLVDLGVAGFRVDASKHMWPKDIAAIQEMTKNTPWGGKPFFYHEVIDQNDGAIKVGEYYSLGRVTEFRYCQKIRMGVQNFGELQGVVDYGWGMADDAHAFIFVDNHDNQRGHGGGGQIVTHEKPLEYRLAVAFTLAWNYGFTRVMSSYAFGDNSDQGPPHNADYTTADVPINSDGSCGGGWVCEHRWPSIRGMALFRNAVTGTDVKNYNQQGDVVGFSRGNKGFFAMGKQSFDKTFKTGLPAGQYCDLISNCQQKITVDSSGNAQVKPFNNQDPVVAFIVGGPTGPIREGSGGSNPVGTNAPGGSETTAAPPVTTPHVPSCENGACPNTLSPTVDYGSDAWRHTVILIERQTSPGQDLFIRGGIDHVHRTGCTQEASTSPCSIPIKHRQLGTSSHFDKVNSWSAGDNFLDWYGAENSQGSYHGQKPEGTPAVWTSNDKNNAGYSQYNRFGQHYWLIDVDMDCSKTENSYFEFKAIVGSWEADISSMECTGSEAGKHPYTSANHIARCGFLNVFHFGKSACTIDPLT